MAVLRALAWIFLLVAMIALVGDLTRANTGGALVMTSSLAHWKSMAPQSLAAFSGFIQKLVHPVLWDPLMTRVLLLPAWLLIGAIGVMTALLGRRKRRVNIFAN